MKTNNKTQETKPSNPKSKTAQKENTPFAESVVLKPVGYPFDFAMMENNLEIIDKTLFEEYAREQWLGLVVKENSYLFDQKIIPDYGFQIVSVSPNNSIIAENTEIKLLDIEERNYHQATQDIIEELQNIGKPFIVIVNSKDPSSTTCQNVVESYRQKHDVPVVAMDVTNMLETQVVHLLQEALNEFGVNEVPRYIAMLSRNHWLKQTLDEALRNSLVEIKKIRDIQHLTEGMESYDFIKRAYLKNVDTSKAQAVIKIEERSGLYDELLTDIVGYEVDRSSILALLQELMTIKEEYDGISNALSMVKQTGYGYAIPSLDEIELSKPEIIKQGSRYGMKLNSKAATTYMIKVEIESTFEPIIGSKQQAESFIDYLNHNGNDKQAIFKCEYEDS